MGISRRKGFTSGISCRALQDGVRSTLTRRRCVSLPLLLHGLGSIGVFSSRAFLPAFVTSLILRFGPQVPWLARSGLLRHVRDVPTWFTSDTALIALGLLA